MNGKRDPEDVALTDGRAYFVEWSKFEQYLSDTSREPEEVSRTRY